MSTMAMDSSALVDLSHLSAGQIAFFLAYLCCTGLYFTAIFFRSKYAGCTAKRRDEDLANDGEASKAGNESSSSQNSSSMAASSMAASSTLSDAAAASEAGADSYLPGLFNNAVTRALTLHPKQLDSAHDMLASAVETGTHVAVFFLADRTSLFPDAKKHYSHDVFWFIYGTLVFVAAAYSLANDKTPGLLNRDQTEEWKGWMQVLFLLYHYYNAADLYNAIRIFIAAYVWMTGFGNFSYYHVRRDFSVGRFVQMLWRLNFLVALCCVALNNDYLVYYICPMHTLFTIMVYFGLYVRHELNTNTTVIIGKFVALTALVAVCWSSKAMFDMLWSPVYWLVKYDNPHAKPGTPGADPMHEWWFRTSLDRYVWIFGMVCAFMHPRVEKFIKNYVDPTPTSGTIVASAGASPSTRLAARAVVLVSCAVTGYWWYAHVYTLPKLEYNKLHPFTSWIPITIYIMLRNFTPTLRASSLHLFGWLGKITLETYICQYHIWLSTSSVANGQPKMLLDLVPGYPLLNFMLVTIIYVCISHRLFSLTCQLRDHLLPAKDNKALSRNLVLMAACCIILYGLGATLKFSLRSGSAMGGGAMDVTDQGTDPEH